jgi:hypothetical protein
MGQQDLYNVSEYNEHGHFLLKDTYMYIQGENIYILAVVSRHVQDALFECEYQGNVAE